MESEHMGKKYLFLSLLLAFITLPVTLKAEVTAQQVLSMSASNLKKSNSLSCEFSITAGGKKINGILKRAGNKFAVSTPATSSWYNGQLLWTYNSSSRETTLIKPTKDEIMEINPLLYIDTYSSDYNAALAKTQTKGYYTVNLFPKKKGSGIKVVVVTIESKTWRPIKLTVIQTGWKSVIININKLNFSAKFNSSEFEYPKNKYPNVEIIDLR